MRITQVVNLRKSLGIAALSLLIGFSASADCDTAAPELISRLESGSHATRTWAQSWGITWSLATAGQAVAGSVTQGSSKTDLWVGAGSSALGLIPTFVHPPAITRFEEDRKTCSSTADLENLIDRYADDDRMNSGWRAQAGNIGVNLAVGMILGLGFGHWSAAAISMGVGIPVGEAMILTYPNAAEQLRDRATSMAISPSPVPGGCGLLVSFGI